MTASFYGTAVYGTSTYSLPSGYAGSYPRPVTLKIFTNGYDVTNQVEATTIEISSILTRQIDTCSFLIVNAQTVPAKEWDEVKIYDDTTRLFGGYIQTIDDLNAGAGLRVDGTVHGSDYACYLDHIKVIKEWTTAITDADILTWLFNTYWPGFIDTTTYVTALKSYPRIRFNRLTLRQVVDQLADAGGGDWYIDYDRRLHFFYSSGETAPFAVSSTPNMTTTLPYDNMVKNLDGTGVVNRVEVVGGKYLSDNAIIYIQGTGQDVRAVLPFFLHEQSGGATGIQVWRNDGTLGVPIWTPMTVKVGYIDTLVAATDVLFYFQDKVLQQTAAWPALANAIKIACRYEVPLRSRYSNAMSYAFYNKTWFDKVIVNPDITDKITARAAAQGELVKNALGNTAVQFDVVMPGLLSGMLVGVNNPNLSISDTFLIQRSTCRFKTGGYATWNISCGIYRPDLIDFIIALARKANAPPIWRVDEVLDELVPTAEGITVTETTSAPTPTVGPYKWEVAADHHFHWDFAKWS